MNEKKYLILFLLFLNLGCSRSLIIKQENVFQVEGAVSYNDKALPGAMVGVYPQNDINEPFKLQAADINGKFNIGLPAGNYYFKAWKIMSPGGGGLRDGDLFCYYGGNPVNVSGPKKGLPLNCVKIHALEEAVDESLDGAELSGKIIDVNGRPLRDANIYLFSVSNPDFRRMADKVSSPTVDDGGFSITFDAPGTYFLMARKRRNTDERGPLRIGDYYGYYYANPIEIKNKTKANVIIECVEKKKDQLPDEPSGVPSGKSAVRGRIIDKNGVPVSGVFAFMYRDEFATGRKPDYKSMVTGKSGEYTVIIEEPGSYVLGARKSHGGPPEPGGDIFGFYGGQDYKMEIRQGEIKENVNIPVEEVK